MAFILQSLRQTSEHQQSLTPAGGDELMPPNQYSNKAHTCDISTVIFCYHIGTLKVFAMLNTLIVCSGLWWCVPVSFVFVSLPMGEVSDRVPWFSPVSIMPQKLHTHIHSSMSGVLSLLRGAGKFGKM